jgi:hypothetical protein
VSAAFAGKKDGSLMEARFSPEWHFAMADLFRLFFFSHPGFTWQR